MVHGAREHWVAAITNYTKVVALIPEDHSAYHFLAAAFVQVGDLEGYHRHRGEILRRFGQTSDPVTAERMAKDCLILPPPAADLPAIARMADVAIAAGSENKPWPYFQFAKALAEYRQGRFESAVEWSEKVAAVKGDLYRTVQAQMVLAMAQQQLRKMNEAREALGKGLEIADARFPKPGKGSLDDQWNDWIIAHALMREAKALIESDGKASSEVK
jgi:tetratricopeptide (TPR) repeat protein